MSDPILDDLNDEQRAAVAFERGPLMVLAGAGSGKTRVITRRIARLLRDGERPFRILALTFTNKAAGEMARRVQELGGERVHVSTFHSACARFLRQDGERLGYPRDFTIYDTQDRDSVLKMLMGEYGLDGQGVKPAQVGRRLSQMKNLCPRREDVVFGHGSVDKILEKLWDPYQRSMQKLGALDFDDLLGRFRDLLVEFPDVRESYAEQFRWLLVDEFQDTNRVQYELLRLLVGGERNITVVGDPDQSIYRFRGAEIRNILDFQRDFPGTNVVRLEQNYRSTATILRAAEGVIANNRERLEKRLRTDNADGDPIEIYAAQTPQDEARQIGNRAQELIGAGVEPSEIAVFYRSHFLSRGLEEALRNAYVPYQVIGGVGFFERREVKDLLAYLRVLVNPLDDVSMERVINVPPRGIGRVTLDKLRTLGREQGMSLVEVIAEPTARATLPAKPRAALAALSEVFEAARAQKGEAHAAMRAIEQGIGYIAHLSEMGDPEDEARVENIVELHSDAAWFDQNLGGGLTEYLAQVSLMTSDERAAGDDGPKVSLMTVHAAKGLEFDHVFIAGLEEGVFPHARAMEEQGGEEEERRLLYVALTRARRTLWIGHARERMVGGFTERQVRSPFLRELPRECVSSDLRDFEDPDDDAHDDDGDFAQGGFEPDVDQTDPSEVLAPGRRVRHREYGIGTLLRVSGQGMLARAVVRFDSGHERTLLLEYAGLRPVGDVEAT